MVECVLQRRVDQLRRWRLIEFDAGRMQRVDDHTDDGIIVRHHDAADGWIESRDDDGRDGVRVD
jgi:hypothetical protein